MVATSDIDPSVAAPSNEVRAEVERLTSWQNSLPSSAVALASLFVAINGSLQAEEQKVDVRIGADRTRVYMRSAVTASGIELPGKVGETYSVIVIGPHEPVVQRDMVLKHFAIGHAVNGYTVARYIFEAPSRRANA